MVERRISRTVISSALVVVLFAVVLGSWNNSSAAGEINTGYFGNVAIKGYDPVAYFTKSRAVEGSKDITTEWLGATWQFSSTEHRELFAANSIRYAPQYGGLCSDGVAFGVTTTNIDPHAWRIIDGKLYLNYDPGAAAELEETPGQVAKADKNWPEIRAKLLEN